MYLNDVKPAHINSKILLWYEYVKIFIIYHDDPIMAAYFVVCKITMCLHLILLCFL